MSPRYSRYYTYVRPALKNKFVRTYSSLVFSLIAVTIFTLYALRPTIQTIVSLNKSISQQKETLVQIKNKINNLTQGRSNYENLSPGVREKLTQIIPNNPSLPGLINQLNISAAISEASLSGLQFESIELENSNKPLNKKPEIKEVVFTLTARGDYSKLVQFLEELQKMNRLVSVTWVTFNKPQDSAIFLSINAKAY